MRSTQPKRNKIKFEMNFVKSAPNKNKIPMTGRLQTIMENRYKYPITCSILCKDFRVKKHLL